MRQSIFITQPEFESKHWHTAFPGCLICTKEPHRVTASSIIWVLAGTPNWLELVKKYSTNHLKDFSDFEIKFDNYHSTNNDLNKEIVEDIYNKLNEYNICVKSQYNFNMPKFQIKKTFIVLFYLIHSYLLENREFDFING